ncbi:alcohol dehydrogenase [Beauveria brongniartii RCEF 3172]|uniref:Alcohol dehydrogenase n=1 Tax=Beauveria brongniartii RCEF 3172 TaxID=1081107 RepID=A0A167CPD6_9HYPO|nr:alcohol dehydrogenase [Beauveria brongniartii RCEF 3172]
MAQGLKAIKIGAVISIIGFVGGEAEIQPGFLDCLMNLCTARGLMVGSRAQMEEMCRAIEANINMLKPVVDKKLFKLEDVKEAYEYQWSGKHVGKVCIEIA